MLVLPQPVHGTIALERIAAQVEMFQMRWPVVDLLDRFQSAPAEVDVAQSVELGQHLRLEDSPLFVVGEDERLQRRVEKGQGVAMNGLQSQDVWHPQGLQLAEFRKGTGSHLTHVICAQIEEAKTSAQRRQGVVGNVFEPVGAKVELAEPSQPVKGSVMDVVQRVIAQVELTQLDQGTKAAVAAIQLSQQIVAQVQTEQSGAQRRPAGWRSQLLQAIGAQVQRAQTAERGETLITEPLDPILTQIQFHQLLQFGEWAVLDGRQLVVPQIQDLQLAKTLETVTVQVSDCVVAQVQGSEDFLRAELALT